MSGLRLAAAFLFVRHAEGLLPPNQPNLQSHLMMRRTGDAAARPSLLERLASTASAAPRRATRPATLGHSADWFEGFSASESSYDADGMSAERVRRGTFDATRESLTGVGEEVVREREFYHETPSGGPDRAFQTLPALQSERRAPRVGEWRPQASGELHQELLPAVWPERGGHGREPAAGWFDTSPHEHDTFGRPRAPHEQWDGGAVAGFSAYTQWEERTVNTTLQCAEIGCSASATLTAFDPSVEYARNCRLHFHVHPTDFDDEHSRETVDEIMANNVVLRSVCDPMASGCNGTQQAPLHACLANHALDGIMNDTVGSLSLSARISPMVDECAFEGNLLAAVAAVTCMVTPRLTPAPRVVLPVVAEASQTSVTTTWRLPLQCPDRGCGAQVVFNSINRTDLAEISNCLLNVRFNQTDFDSDHGVTEHIEYIRVDGANASTDLAPGLNPCNARNRNGTVLTQTETEYVAISDRDVTADVADGALVVEAAISPNVDECASNGYLMDGWAELACTLLVELSAPVLIADDPTSVAAALPAPAPSLLVPASVALPSGNATDATQL